ncbi:MAG: hypothetical protein AAF654_10535 [Myxococcota bacterium]
MGLPISTSQLKGQAETTENGQTNPNMPSRQFIAERAKVIGGETHVVALTHAQADAIVAHCQERGIECKKTKLYDHENKCHGWPMDSVSVYLGDTTTSHKPLYRSLGLEPEWVPVTSGPAAQGGRIRLDGDLRDILDRTHSKSGRFEGSFSQRDFREISAYIRNNGLRRTGGEALLNVLEQAARESLRFSRDGLDDLGVKRKVSINGVVPKIDPRSVDYVMDGIASLRAALG